MKEKIVTKELFLMTCLIEQAAKVQRAAMLNGAKEIAPDAPGSTEIPLATAVLEFSAVAEACTVSGMEFETADAGDIYDAKLKQVLQEMKTLCQSE